MRGRISGSLRGLATLVLIAAGAVRGEAQMDPEPRANLELGVEGPLKGDGPISGYFFLMWNRPHFPQEDQYLRVVVAPVYLHSELVIDKWPGPGQAVGLGFGGGYKPFDQEEFRDGGYQERESFLGHGAEVQLSYYPRIKLWDVLPLEGQVRFRPQYVLYERGDDTDRSFQLPRDTPVYYGRAGLRLGGVPPELLPQVALEVSLWHEFAYRQIADDYGFPDQRQELLHLSRRSWGRLGGVYTPVEGHTARVFLTAGGAGDTDALSAFRMGSALAFRREFPLVLHGYFVDEIFAKRFWLLNVSYRFPLFGSDHVQLQVAFDYAKVDYLKGHELPRSSLRGAGAGLGIRLTPRLSLVLGYGYGFDAPRNSSFGGHEVNGFLEWKFISPPVPQAAAVSSR
jgi:hypothetical protein